MDTTDYEITVITYDEVIIDRKANFRLGLLGGLVGLSATLITYFGIANFIGAI